MTVLKRLVDPLAMWLGSFLLAVWLLVAFLHVPLGPLLIAGGITLAITIIRALRAR